MLPEIERLLVLQDRDRKIRALKQELKVAPLERQGLDATLGASISQLEAAKLQAKEVEVEKKKLEIDAQTRRDQIAKFQTQKFQTRKNEEFQALNNEIDRFEKDIRQIEDRELDLMETAEKMKLAVAEADKSAKSVKEMVERQLADIATKTQAREGQLQAIETERAGLAVGLDEDLLDTYDRLFQNKQEAVVALSHDVCMGCHMKITAQTSVSVKGGKAVVHCENCGRILYRDDN